MTELETCRELTKLIGNQQELGRYNEILNTIPKEHLTKEYLEGCFKEDIKGFQNLQL